MPAATACSFRTAIPLLCIAAAVECAGAQVPIQWKHDTESAFATARRQRRPVFIVIPGERSATRTRDSFEDAQKQSFSDPRIVALVEQRFVPLKLQRSGENQPLFQLFGLPIGAQLRGVIVAPDGTLLEHVGGGELANREKCFTNLKKGLTAYVEHLYTNELAPSLQRGAGKPTELKTTLELIREFRIEQADGDVVNLLSSELQPDLRKCVYATLAELSTESAVTALLERCGADREAAVALKDCSPAAAELIAGALNEQYDATHLAAYSAVCAIVKDPQSKGPRFWQNAEAEAKRAEVERIRKRAIAAVAAWREQNAE